MTEVYYKVLDSGGRTFHGGTGAWHLPNGKRPGKWMPRIDNIEACARGYHVVTANQLLSWLGPEIFEVECRGDHIDHGDKHVFSQARLLRRTGWNDTTARLFAADCAERVLHIFEKDRPGDARLRECIEVGRRYARGDATRDELDAARDAAWAAAGAAARAAARAAAWAAAGAAARDAAWAAARDAAREAAWDAARAAAGDAAWAAARAAAREWQNARLVVYLNGEVEDQT